MKKLAVWLLLAVIVVVTANCGTPAQAQPPKRVAAVALMDAPGQYRVITTWSVPPADIDSIIVVSGGLGNDGIGFTHRYLKTATVDTMFFTAIPGQSGTSTTCVMFKRRQLASACGTATWAFNVADTPPAAPLTVTSTAVLQ